MQIIRNPTKVPSGLKAGAVTIGNFDGVHLGHARIVRRLIARARKVGGPSVVFTFDPHPVRLLRPQECPPPLTWTERKAQLLEDLGVDGMVAYPTDEELLQLSPQAFFERIVLKTLDARALVEGPNFFFGHNRAGTIEVLRELSTAARIPVDVVEPFQVDGEYVSSSRVRRLIQEGQMGVARRLLTAPYRIRGMVTHGAGRGAKIGFPTANLDAVDTLLPGEGVYAGWGYVDGALTNLSGQSWPAAINLGANPTFGDGAIKVEVHLIGCERTLYGEPLEVDFLARIRDIHSFPSVDALQAQLKKDVAQVKDIANGSSE